MADHHRATPDPAERQVLREVDLVLADLLAQYMHRREHGAPPQAHDLLAQAAEWGPDARQVLLSTMAFYEAMTAAERG